MNTQIVPLVEQEVVRRMQARASFTALDISNTLKSERYPIRHDDVAGVVREIYASGSMDFYDFDRRLIDVVTDLGTKKTRAFLYLHDGTRERDYTTRSQTALSLLPPDQARSLPDDAARDTAVIPPRPQLLSRTHRSIHTRKGIRRDGALAVPRTLVAQMGWDDGATLALKADDNSLTLVRSCEGNVRVWSGKRVRLCRGKLRLYSLTAANTTVAHDVECLRLTAK